MKSKRLSQSLAGPLCPCSLLWAERQEGPGISSYPLKIKEQKGAELLELQELKESVESIVSWK